MLVLLLLNSAPRRRVSYDLPRVMELSAGRMSKRRFFAVRAVAHDRFRREEVMTTLMLNREEVFTVAVSAKQLLKKNGFQYESYVPVDGDSFRARHPLSGQEISVYINQIDAQKASDPTRIYWARIEIDNSNGKRKVLKPWRLEKVNSKYEPVGDFADWIAKNLGAELDTVDRRFAPVRLWHRVFKTLESETYPPRFVLPMC